jgi:lipopolysaccharide export system protein LptA
MKIAPSSIAVLLLVWLGSVATAHAERADRGKPVTLDADRVRLDDVKKTAVYEGRVVLTQGTMTIKAERIDVSQDAHGMTSGEATGSPVYFRQKMEGRPDFMEAEADRAVYDANTGVLRLIGSAHLKRGEDELRGSLIVYDTRTERYQAQGSGEPGGQGRVHAVIRPAAGVKEQPEGQSGQ